jgi:hypothetical protein
MKTQDFIIKTNNTAQQTVNSNGINNINKDSNNKEQVSERFQLPKSLWVRNKRARFKTLHKESTKTKKGNEGEGAHPKDSDGRKIGNLSKTQSVLRPKDVDEGTIKKFGNAKQQAAIAISMKKAGKKPKNEEQVDKQSINENLKLFCPGTIIRTKDMLRRGIVESIELYRPFNKLAVYFRTSDNKLLRTPIDNVMRIPMSETATGDDNKYCKE